jgi:hypothetical protein
MDNSNMANLSNNIHNNRMDNLNLISNSQHTANPNSISNNLMDSLVMLNRTIMVHLTLKLPILNCMQLPRQTVQGHFSLKKKTDSKLVVQRFVCSKLRTFGH